MSRLPDRPWYDVPMSFDPKQATEEVYAIGGKMVTIRMELTDALAHMEDELWKKHIRDEMARKLGEYILYNRLCETTVMQSPLTFGKTVAIRCYLAPDDQVKLLRVHKV